MKNKAFSKRIKRCVSALTAFLLMSACLMFSSCSTSKRLVILLAGDSRSSTDYTFYGETLEKKTGAVVWVEGASGKNAAYNASAEYLNRVTGREHDVSIWLVGGNDTGSKGTIGTFSSDSALAELGEEVVEEISLESEYKGDSFIQAVDYSMRKYKEFYKDRKDAPVMIYCTDLPQQRDSEDSEWSLEENWERKRLAIIECCEKNGVECLDLYDLCNFDMSIEPMYHEPTDMKNNYGEC